MTIGVWKTLYISHARPSRDPFPFRSTKHWYYTYGVCEYCFFCSVLCLNLKWWWFTFYSHKPDAINLTMSEVFDQLNISRKSGLLFKSRSFPLLNIVRIIQYETSTQLNSHRIVLWWWYTVNTEQSTKYAVRTCVFFSPMCVWFCFRVCGMNNVVGRMEF